MGPLSSFVACLAGGSLAMTYGSPRLHADTPPPLSLSEEEDVLAALMELLNTPVTVASSKAEGILKTPSTVSVVDRDMLRKFNIQTITEALDLVAGVDLMRTHQKRDLVTVRGVLQEHYASKVLILINGVPTWIANTGEGNPYRIDPSDVERIEVLRGPASVLYGSNAYVGAVNIVLRKGMESEGEFHAATTDRGGYLAGTRLSMVYGPQKSLTVSANVNNLEGPAAPFQDEGARTGTPAVKYPPVTAPFQDYERVRNATLAFQWGTHRVLANLYRGDEGFLGNSPTFPNPASTPPYSGDGIGNNEATSGRLLNYTFDADLAKTLNLKAGATYDWQERNFSRRGDDTRRSNIQGLRTSAFLKLNYQITGSLNADFGGDYEKRTSNEYTVYDPTTGQVLLDTNLKDRSVAERSAFAQLGYQHKRFNLLAGSRFTKNENAGSNVSSRGTAVFLINDRSSLKLIAGQSFRAPTLFEQFFVNDPARPTVLGNANLKPEKASTIELAYLTAYKGIFLQAQVYTSTYDDKIMRITDPANPAAKKYVNGGTFKATGLELELKYAGPGGMNAFLNLDYLLNTDHGDEHASDPGHYNFKYVPKYHLSAGIAKVFGSWFLSASGTYSASTHGPEDSWRVAPSGSWTQGPSQEVRGQGFASFNFGYTQTLSSTKLTHTFSLKNAGNKQLVTPDYMRRVGLNAVPTDGLGRQASYTLRVNF